MNIVLRSVPISILSLAYSNSVAVNFSKPSTAALMAAMFTKFARSEWEEKKDEVKIHWQHMYTIYEKHICSTCHLYQEK